MTETYIVTSNSKKRPNWNGEEFSKAPAKIYPYYTLLLEDMRTYGKSIFNGNDIHDITIVSLTNEQMAEKIKAKEAIF